MIISGITMSQSIQTAKLGFSEELEKKGMLVEKQIFTMRVL